MKPDLHYLFTTYADYVYRICLRYSLDEAEAEDLSQDIFVKIHDSLHSFRSDSRISTWIYRIAINYCIDNLRKNKRREELSSLLDPVVVRNLNDHEDSALASIALKNILRQLNPKVRKILFLSCAEGLSYSEIAEVLGMSKAAVAKTVSRSLEKLQ